jgi:hypothetical protein
MDEVLTSNPLIPHPDRPLEEYRQHNRRLTILSSNKQHHYIHKSMEMKEILELQNIKSC